MSPLGWLYGKIIDARNARYEDGTLKSHSLGAPVISVGNITVGGTGKTPLVAYIAETLAVMGEEVCIISRGYKRENGKTRVLVSDGEKRLANVNQAGDEPFELASKLIGKAIVISDADRVSAGKWAVENYGITAFILDDAFQHRKAHRDLDIVVIDATNPFGNEKTLPFGILREPFKNLRRADLFIISRANLVNSVEPLKTKIREFNNSAPIVISENVVSKVLKLEDFVKNNDVPILDPATQNGLAFCAIGNPDNFFRQLTKSDFKISATKAFPDHHAYSKRDFQKLESAARMCGADVFFTTAKDAVKLSRVEFYRPCYVVENEMIFDDEKKLRETITAVFKTITEP